LGETEIPTTLQSEMFGITWIVLETICWKQSYLIKEFNDSFAFFEELSKMDNYLIFLLEES